MKKLMMTLLGAALGCASSLFAEGVINSQSYVSSGLVGQWDAIENNGVGQHSDSITAWKDLTGKTGDFILMSSIAAIEDAAIEKTGQGCLGYINHKPRCTGIRTIEAVVSNVTKDEWDNVVFVSSNQHVSARMLAKPKRLASFFDDTKKIVGVDYSVAPSTIVGLYNDDAKRIVIATNCYWNGEAKGKPEEDLANTYWSMDFGWISLGGIYEDLPDKRANGRYGYKIHAIRFYTRELTPAEIARNAFLDRMRFSPEGVLPEVSRCVLTDDGKANVFVRVETDNGNVPCELSAKIYDSATDTTTEHKLGTAEDSESHAYEIPGLVFGRKYEITISGKWSFSDEKFEVDLRTFTACVCESLRYAQDGLVGQWDAIENAGTGVHSDGIAAWADLTGKTGNFDLDMSIAEIGERFIRKTNQGCLGSIDAVQRTDVRTIEAVISDVPTTLEWLNAVFISSNQNISVNDKGGTRRYVFLDGRRVGVTWSEKSPSLSTVVGLYDDAMTAANCYQNGENLGDLTYDISKYAFWSRDFGRISLCGIYGDAYNQRANARCPYNIHAIRFYTRKLTPDEIARHAFIDQLRFSSGGLATAKWSVTGDNKVKVYGTVNTLGGNAACELTAICREGGTGVTTTNELGTVSSSEGTYEYIVDGLDASKQYDIVLHGVWTMNADNSVTFVSDFRAEAEKLTGARKYVQKGLVGQWDAIENAGFGQHMDSITEWVDLTGNTGDFSLEKSIAEIGERYIKKTGAGCLGSIDAPMRRTDIKAIEVVVSDIPLGGTWIDPVFISTNQNITLVDNNVGKRSFFFDYSKKVAPETAMPAPYGPATIVGLYYDNETATNCYQNGEELGTPSRLTGNNDHWTRDFGRISLCGIFGADVTYNANKTSGQRIHAVRFYTNELTAAEIAQNAILDQLRFSDEVAEVARTDIGANGTMSVSVEVKKMPCGYKPKLIAVVRDRITGEERTIYLTGETTVVDSKPHEYTISGLNPAHSYEIVIRGEWSPAGGSALKYDFKTFDVLPEADAVPGAVYQVAASASVTNAFDWVVAGSGLRRSPKAGDVVYVGLTYGTYQLLLSGAESSLINLRAFAGAGADGSKTLVDVQEGAEVSTRDGIVVGAAEATVTASGELHVSGGSLTAGGRGLVCGGGEQRVVVSNGMLSATKLSFFDADSLAQFLIVGSGADITIDAVDAALSTHQPPVFWDYRFDTSAFPGAPGIAPRKMSASDATVYGHFRIIPYGGFQLTSTNIFPLVVHEGGKEPEKGSGNFACTDLWDYSTAGNTFSAELRENGDCEMADGVSRAEGLVRGYLKLPRIVNPANCRSAIVRMKVEPVKKSVEDIVAAIREQYPEAQEINKGGYNVEVPLLLDRLAKGESNKVVFDFSEFALFDDIESGKVTTNAVVTAITAEIKKPGIVLIVR